MEISKRLFIRGYARLLKYAQNHLDLYIEEMYETLDGFKLGKWVKVIRNSWRRGRLSPDQIHRLEAIGFAIDANLQGWESMYFFAKDYFNKNGDMNIERIYKTDDGVMLGAWVEFQKKYSYRLTSTQAEKLREIGVDIEHDARII